MTPSVVRVVGNPRPGSRTHSLARDLADALAGAIGGDASQEVDLAALGPSVLDWQDEAAKAATQAVLDADVLVVASPTYKATYTGLLKAFLDRIGTGALGGTPAIGVLLGGAPDHRLAVDVHLTPLLQELGASVPVRGLFVLESELPDYPAAAQAWAATAARLLTAFPV